MPTHSAADSASGYLYQCRYALFAALRQQAAIPGLQVSIECFDDVAFSVEGSPHELVQTKHSFTAKAMTDMAKQFWKTLGIWTRRIIAHPTELGKVKLTFVTTAVVDASSGLSLLRPAACRDVGAATQKLEAAALASKNQEVAWATKLFLEQSPLLRQQLVEMIEVVDASPTIVDTASEIASLLRRACRPEHLAPFLERLEGWWFSVAANALATPGGSLIPVSMIDAKIDDLREEFGPQQLPIDYGSTDPSLRTVALLEGRTFVDQLKLVDVGPTGLKIAIVDYFRARQQRSRWARDGLLRPDELSHYGRRLSDNWARRWGRLETKAKSMSPAELASAGQDLYAETTEACIPLREVSEPFISHGSYHILSDQCSIGWHPHFTTHIKPKAAEDDTDSPLE